MPAGCSSGPGPTLPPSGTLPASLTQRSRGKVQEGDLGEGQWGPSALPPNRLLERRWRLSEEQGFLLEVIPLPQGQAVKLFDAHPKHFLELLR